MIIMRGMNGARGMAGVLDDLKTVYQTAKTVGADIIKTVPGAVTSAVTKTVVEKTTPIAQQYVEAKTQRVIKKGNVALFLVGGGTAGALLAGGSWQRRAVGGTILGIAGLLVGWKIGWLEDKAA